VQVGGRFRLATGEVPGVAVLESSSPGGRVEVRFQGVIRSDLPARLQDVAIEMRPPQAGRAGRSFLVTSREGSWRVEAAAIQVHEHPRIFGRAVRLSRFPLHKRVAWMLLLWVARFTWGRAAIQQLAGRR
jgi:hypothetical protein